VPLDFEDRGLLEEVISEKIGHRVEILMPQRGPKRAFLDLVEKNARHSFLQRFRVLKPSSQAIAEALESSLGLPEPPRRIECFDVSHIQGSDTVASMVVWEHGRMKKSDYRKFIIRGETAGDTDVAGLLRDDFASMREAVERRYRRLQAEKRAMPSLILIDGGIGQLHAAASALDKLEIINQPLASIAKKEEILYVLGREDEPIVLERHSPILHLIQQIRDESHRFAVTFHRQRRGRRQLRSQLTEVPGIGERTAQKLLRKFGSVANLRRLSLEELAAAIPRTQAERLFDRLQHTTTVDSRVE
jgi:excinuclease ABC subunit C